jgi:hypothetical protein
MPIIKMISHETSNLIFKFAINVCHSIFQNDDTASIKIVLAVEILWFTPKGLYLGSPMAILNPRGNLKKNSATPNRFFVHRNSFSDALRLR